MVEFGDPYLISQKKEQETIARSAVKHLIDIYGLEFVARIVDGEKEVKAYVAPGNVTKESSIRRSCE